ncbi:MAG: CPBP family intramembrane metalloprotease [Pegethrix bostrychoides GSE-TBD4-15B]|jgi:membrane protease YdiL (CAAX protease family)|uniref:CPBP family intramembrane metalloprotease n=1 Tax=Pegethrix bostrychoides GSE-TBD4-15B TaxID=2839662 RepID=A0A951PAC4_9CYAN|nr:CPBP family intramembrane metalloprotease [Pegethrix bostrychoides GSE-TBD4-15B]
MKKHPIIWFYILAFGISWLGMISAALGSHRIAPFDSPYIQLLSIFYAVGPALAAVIVARTADGKTGVQNLLKGLTRWRVGLVWYIVAVLGSLTLLITAQGLTKLLGFSAIVVTPQVDLSPYFVMGLMVNFFANMCEEIGWRGFALPRLQKRHNALMATLIVGILWSFWHLPIVFLVGNPMAEYPFLWFIIILANAFIYTWIYNSTKGSILLVALFHGSLNVWGLFIPGVSPIAYALVNCVVAIILIAVFGKANLSRQKRVYAG